MINKHKLITSLENKKDLLVNYNKNEYNGICKLQKYLNELILKNYIEVNDQLKSKFEAPGSLLSHEWNGQIIKKFDKAFNNMDEARQWAYETLLNKTTFAVDGSQIIPNKDYSTPIGAVQIGWFENFHSPDGKYEKDNDIKILTTTDLSDENEDLSMEYYVNFKRFEFEIDKILEYMEKNKDANPKPLVFFDGSLIISFITAVGGTGRYQELREHYTNIIVNLLDTCEKTRVPLIGYIDSSRAHDLNDMMCNYNDDTKNYYIPDNKVFDEQMNWGDRTAVLHCKRQGVLNDYGQFKDDICFTYLKTNSNPASRIEFPKWILDEPKLFEEIINIIRAEVIIGKGYIYSIESADSIAVLTNKDKNTFYDIFSQFADKYQLNFTQSQKLTSKQKRR